MLPTLILDTNILVAGLRSSLGASHALLQLVGQTQFNIGLTAALVLEYEAVCMRSLDAINMTAEDIGRLLDHLCEVGVQAKIRFQLRPSVIDPDDEMILEAAVASRSQWIVTHNIRDMVAGAARYNIDVITPGEALRRLGVR